MPVPHTHKYVAESFSFLPCNYERILFTVIKNDKFRAQQQSRTTQAGKMRQLNGGRWAWNPVRRRRNMLFCSSRA